MTARLTAIEALLFAPFVLGCLFIVVVAVGYVARVERHSDYMAPWADREPGDLGGGDSDV